MNEIIRQLQQGKFIIITDDAARENEADLVIAAEYVNEEKITFMLEHCSGIICVPMEEERLKQLELHNMVSRNTDKFSTPFTVSVDSSKILDGGVSARDRVLTICKLLDRRTVPSELGRPGHIFPLRAASNGVLERQGHTEASVDMMKLAGLQKIAVICELIKKGNMLRGKELVKFSETYSIPLISVQEIIEYRKKEGIVHTVKEKVTVKLPTKYGEFTLHEFGEDFTLVKGDIRNRSLVRIHSSCFTSEVLGSLRCDCKEQLDAGMQMIQDEGMLIYLKQEGRGIGLHNKLRAYALQDQGMDTVDANTQLGLGNDLRTYEKAVEILQYFGVTSVKLITNNPAKIKALEEEGILVERVPCIVERNEHNEHYLSTKKEKMGHMLG
jgi:3,4-dihydroxy 2-butanone 4-phosphate synthase / GTP cyclohydrolase II